ncbi:WD40 repeat-like protein [Neoconidiobolus thromboides FSU 785]|nr:WD40 repeat-like protein [Neoconidiobolus thromboides FSU 785]
METEISSFLGERGQGSRASLPNSAGLQLPKSPSASAPARIIPKFTSVKSLIYDIPPKEKVVYNKEAQTSLSMFNSKQYDEEEVERRIKEARKLEGEERDRKALEEAEAAAKLAEEERLRELETEAKNLRELTEEEIGDIVVKEEFVTFLDTASKVMERALCEKYDYLADYTIGDESNKEDKKETVKLLSVFYDDKVTRNRSIMDIAWSPKYPELLLSTYNKNILASNEPDGLTAIWNLHLSDRPEFVFQAQSDVLTAKFVEFHPTLIIGGTYSGQVVIWDTRSSSRLPTLASPLDADCHTHPVYNLQLIGTHQTLNAITASTDGHVCTWQLDMLAKPQDVLFLTHTNHPRTDEVAVTQLGFLSNETSTFLVGTEEGAIYHAHRYERAGSKAGIHPHHFYSGHTGPVTGLSCHPTQTNGKYDFSDLFLTCSFDWSVKLWRSKSPMQAPSSSTPLSIPAIHSFEHSGDYVYDVKWSPIHPALFGVIDGTGHFDLWNLNVDTEAPLISTKVSECALNKLVWHDDGMKVAIGSSDGKLYVYELGEFAVPVPEDWEIFQRTLQDLQSVEVLDPFNSANFTSINDYSSYSRTSIN